VRSGTRRPLTRSTNSTSSGPPGPWLSLAADRGSGRSEAGSEPSIESDAVIGQAAGPHRWWLMRSRRCRSESSSNGFSITPSTSGWSGVIGGGTDASSTRRMICGRRGRFWERLSSSDVPGSLGSTMRRSNGRTWRRATAKSLDGVEHASSPRATRNSTRDHRIKQ